MSKDFKKNKAKRSRSSSSEASNSFVKNVTSRVSGLLPASITKWFSSPSSSSNANGSAQTADVTDSSTDDEALESRVILQPPMKRMRYSSPGGYNYFTNEPNYLISNATSSEFEPLPYSAIQSPQGRNFTNYRSTSIMSSNDESFSERSDDLASVSSYKAHHSMSTTGPSVTNKRKSLFDSSPANAEASLKACAQTANNQMKDLKAPYFKPSLMGSPFYPGRTMYGGAASCYVNQPNIQQRKPAAVKETTAAETALSHSTRRILDLLENYSSPLNEAKRIPQYKRSPRNEGFNITLESAPETAKVISYKTQELHVPSVATILRLRQKSRLTDTTTTARQILASHSSTAHLPYAVGSLQKKETEKSDTSSAFTAKMKPRLTRQLRGDKGNAESDLPTPVVLPSAVLEIDQNNLPKFSFGTTPTSTSIICSTPIVPSARQPISKTNQTPEYKSVIQVPETPKRKTNSVPNSDQFQFSSPVRISHEHPAMEDSLPQFSFGSPERGLDKSKETKGNETPTVIVSTETHNKLTAPKGKDWLCPDCWVTNKPNDDKCICCGHKKVFETSKKPEKCTICKLADSKPNTNKCINCEKVNVNNVNNISVGKAAESTKWKCEDCWVNNDETTEKCLCCGAGNPKKTDVKPIAGQKKSEDEWKCDDCWVKNKGDVTSCVACGGARRGDQIGQKEKVVTFLNTPLKVTNDVLKIPPTPPAPPKWECPSCLVRNDNNKTKCVCCETDKPGTYSQAAEKAFNFGKNTSFKFGIPKTEPSNADKPAETNSTNSTETKKPEETNNNVLSNTPSFSFGVPAKKTDDTVDSTKKSEDSAPKVNFSFGIPNSTPSVPTTTPAFSIPNSKPAEPAPKEEEEKPQEVPKVDFSSPKVDPPKPFANIFSPPPASQQPPEKVSFAVSPPQDKKPLVPNPLLNSTEEKKESPSTTLSLPATTSAAAPQPTASFSFGSGVGVKMESNFFGNVQTTSGSTPSMFAKPETAAPTSGMSMFSKNEPHISGSLFPTDPPTTTPALAPTPTPLFSFGSSAPPTMQQEKPKFNFSLDSDIKLSFGGMPAGNSNIGNTGNALGGNGLAIGSGNGLSAGGILGNNSINPGLSVGGNGLPSASNLGGNGLSNNTSMPTNILGGNEQLNNPLVGGNNALHSSSMFGAGVQKDNSWSANNNIASNNVFGSNATSSNKPAFTFGSSTPFNANNNTPAFGSPPQSTPIVFGMNQNSNNQGSLFGNQPSQPTGPVFGSSQPAAAPAPMGIFGTPNVGAAPAFGSPNPSIPAFEAPSLTPAPAPSFNFGAPQQAGVFGFGQQQQQQPQQAGGVYNFGAQGGGAPVVQFNMGSTPNMAVRRVRKAVRRTTPR